MTCRMDCFPPKVLSNILSMDHNSSHFLNNSIFPLDHSILLRSYRRSEFLLYTMLSTKIFNTRILKFFAMITTDLFDETILFILDLLKQDMNLVKCLWFLSQQYNLGISREIIHSHQNIFLASQASYPCRPHEIHVKKL